MKLIKIDRNGSKHYEGQVPCPRCNGKGIYYVGVHNGQLVPSHVDHGVCFQCLGSGTVLGKWIERTPEYQAKLDARREAKQKAMQEALEAEMKAKEAERQAKEEAERKAEEEKQAQIKAEKAISQFVGNVGDKIEMNVSYVGSGSWEQPSFRGFGTDTMFAHTFKDDAGNKFVWKTQTNPCGTFDEKGITWTPFEEGQIISIKGTIKDHSEYKDEKQTILTRCKIMK